MSAKETKRGKRTREVARQVRRRKRVATPPAAVNVTFRHLEPTVAIREYAERKLANLSRFLKRSCEIHLILVVDKYRQSGEVTFKSGDFSVAAQEETKDLYSVIDLLADKVEKQLRRHREKTVAKRERARSTGEVLSAEEVAPKARPRRS
ncbi:MAG TPA: ribosome-associated translation inhibitor RaiA [Candidatus Binataceae bacterium]|nr:ribosome-associated translation inhibitor RaiA [Candidatus Binataceae bacterium]